MDTISTICTPSLMYSFVKILALIVCGFPITHMFARMISSYLTTHLNKHSGFIAYKLVYYGGVSYIILSLLHELGFNITALLGAAGVIGVAIGFASQTSMSNMVAGLFLLLEQAFEIGDEISFDRISGRVESIDLFSVKIRTTENTLVRIPNELLIKKEMVNVSFFAKRKLLFTIITPYQTDMKQLVDEVRITFTQYPSIIAVAEIRVDEFFNDQCSLRVQALVNNDDIAMIREELLIAMKANLAHKGIIINELYTGSKPTSSDSLHVRIVSSKDSTGCL